ncbi:MAG: hypothetical protein HOD92_04330, partial [Deltaproteobacteria bacterium]|nr:hypothetical protein [Deltaproteobacteria bacterium]
MKKKLAEKTKQKKDIKLTPKIMEKIIKQLISKGKTKGFVTEAEIVDSFPTKPIKKELNAVYDFLADKNIEIVDSTKKVDLKDLDNDIRSQNLDFENSNDFSGGEAANTADSQTTIDQSSDDPVRMYLREMGSIKLLTRDGEVDIAKKIEKGQHEMLDILLRSELIVNYLFDLGKKLKNGK